MRTAVRSIVLTQFAAALVVAGIAGWLGGRNALVSGLLGGLCCAIPNALFALRLFISARRPGGTNPAVFFIGEFIKILATLALIGAVVWQYHALHWPAFVAGIIVVLKSYLILLVRVRP